MMRRGAKRPRFSIDGQPVFENDDSSNHSGLGIMDYDDNSLSQQNETSTNSSDQHHFPQNQFVPDRSRRIQRSSIKPSNDDNANLNASLDHLLRLLLQKDREGFFQYPVTDQVGSAPRLHVLHHALVRSSHPVTHKSSLAPWTSPPCVRRSRRTNTPI